MAKDLMSGKLLMIGGSAGSLSVLMQVLPLIRKDLPFAIAIVLHRGNSGDSMLVNLFSAKTRLPVKEIEDKEPVLPGYVYLAPADYHVLFEKDHTFSLDDSEKINYSRPSIDVSFETAAETYGKNLACLLLSGANNDGVLGLVAAKEHQGWVMVQHPDTAEVPFMPEQAILRVKVDLIAGIEEMVTFINTWA